MYCALVDSVSFQRLGLTAMRLTNKQCCSTTSLPVETPMVLDPVTDLSLLEIRIGKIVEVSKHPEADNLYVEKIDVGEATGLRTMVSGLTQYCTPEQLLNRLVVVLCNLKPRAFKGITSQGMLLCVSNDSHTKVEPIIPPSNAVIGELVTFPGHRPAPVEAGNKATKAFGKIGESFHSDDNGNAQYLNAPFTTTSGVIKASFKGKIS